MLFELLMAVFMERGTPKGSGNSGLPSSQADADGPNRLVVEVRKAPATECRACGRGLGGVAPHGHERRFLVDIVLETREATVEAEVKTCPRCRTETRGAFPDDMPGPLQHGHGVVAFAVHLLAARTVPLKRTAQALKALTGRTVAEATLLAWTLRLHEALADWEAKAIESLLAMPALHADETGMRINRKNHWLHTIGAGSLTVKSVRRGRGCEAIDDIGIIPRCGGVLVHDRWASCFTYAKCRHALCCAHLLRDLKFVEDAHGHAWARLMAKLLRETCRKVSGTDAKALDEKAFKAVRKRYRTILAKAGRELPNMPLNMLQPERYGHMGDGGFDQPNGELGSSQNLRLKRKTNSSRHSWSRVRETPWKVPTRKRLKLLITRCARGGHSSAFSGGVGRGSCAWSLARTVRPLKASLRIVRPSPSRRLKAATRSWVTPPATWAASKPARSPRRSTANGTGCLPPAPRSLRSIDCAVGQDTPTILDSRSAETPPLSAAVRWIAANHFASGSLACSNTVPAVGGDWRRQARHWRVSCRRSTCVRPRPQRGRMKPPGHLRRANSARQASIPFCTTVSGGSGAFTIAFAPSQCGHLLERH